MSVNINMATFKFNTNTLWSLQNLRIQTSNRIYAFMVEGYIKKSPLYPQIQQMRKNQQNKVATAKLIKKALTELGYTDAQLKIDKQNAKKADPIYQGLIHLEKQAATVLQGYLDQMPIYTNWLSKITGISTLTSAKIISIVGNITRFQKPSQLCSYFGVGDPALSKRVHGVQANYSPRAKALLLGVMADNQIKQKGQYNIVYYTRKALTLKTHPEWHNLNADGTKNTGKNMNPKHADKDARRVMMKRFLIEFWQASYKSLGLNPPTVPYVAQNPHHNMQPNIMPYP